MATEYSVRNEFNIQRESLPPFKEFFAENNKDAQNLSPFSLRRRHSVALPVTKPAPPVEEELEPVFTIGPKPSDSPLLALRRTSLDSNFSKIALPPKEEEKPQRERRQLRKRSISEDAGDNTDSEEEIKPKKRVVKNAKRGRRCKGKGFECEGKDRCTLCMNGTPYYLQKSMNPGWRETLLAVFEHFSKRITYREWREKQLELGESSDVSLDDDWDETDSMNDVKWLYLPDSYAFLEYHWDTLCPPQHRSRAFNGTNWRKTLQDTLSHNRTYFISGKDLFGKTGYWRLTDTIPHHIGFGGDHKGSNEIKRNEPLAPAKTTMYTIDSILKKSEVLSSGSQSGLRLSDSFLESYPPEDCRDKTPAMHTSPSFPELEILISAIEKMQNI